MMDPVQIASVLVSLIAASGAYFAARASSKASQTNVVTSSRVEMEKEAYERARKLDTETIARQDQELEELRQAAKSLAEGLRALNTKNESLIKENDDLKVQNRKLNSKVDASLARLTRLERRTSPPDTDELLRVRHEDIDPPINGETNGR